jgi:hypothetical protein
MTARLKVTFINSVGDETSVDVPVGDSFDSIYETLPQVFCGLGFHPDTVKDYFDNE